MRIRYDHAFTNDPKHRFHKKMERLGFKLWPGQTKHPNRHFCRFVMFKESPNEALTYLEFVDCRDPKHTFKMPGLSFGFVKGLETFAREIRQKGLRCKVTHRNYEWKMKERLPGWNFLLFQSLGFRTLFPWVTEYEPHPKRKPKPVIKHPNGARRILAIEIQINPAGRKFFNKLLGKDLNQPITLNCGRRLYFTPGPKTRLTHIIIEAKSLRRVLKYKVDGLTEWRGRPAALIRNPNQMWDLFIVAENTGRRPWHKA